MTRWLPDTCFRPQRWRLVSCALAMDFSLSRMHGVRQCRIGMAAYAASCPSEIIYDFAMLQVYVGDVQAV